MQGKNNVEELMIRRAVDADIPALDRLLFQVHQVHHEARPDLFKAGAKKYTDAQLRAILADDKTPVFVAERGGAVVGYAFCIHKQFVNDNNMTDIKTLYIDDLAENCDAARAAGFHARHYGPHPGGGPDAWDIPL